MNELLIFIVSLCLTLALFELATRRRRLVVALAGVGSLGGCAFITPWPGFEALLVSSLAGVPVGYLVHIASNLIPSNLA